VKEQMAQIEALEIVVTAWVCKLQSQQPGDDLQY